jgi:anthranilate phosphoribosyltransferase
MIDIEVKTLREIGFKRALVMHGLDHDGKNGMDEVSSLGETHVAELKQDGAIEKYTLTPEDLGIKRARFEDIASSRNVQHDSLALLRVIMGKDQGPRSDIACINTAPLLYVAGKAKDLKEGIAMARNAIADGKALEKLRDWVTWQNDTPEDGLPVLEQKIQEA